MAGDPFTSAIFRWLNAVAADPELPPAAFKLAYVISQHINRSSLEAWPSQTTLKCAIGVKDERSVRRLTDVLEERGHLLTRRRRQSSMVYRLAQDRTELSYQPISEAASDPDTRPDENDRSIEAKADGNDRSTDQDRTFDAVRPDISVHQDRTNLSAKLLKEPLKEPGSERAPERATLIPDDFRFSEETRAYALDRLGSEEAVIRSEERFANHYRQVDGRQAKSRDWQAKARLWIDDDARKHSSDKSVVSAAKRLQEKLLSFDARPAGMMPEGHWDDVLSTYKKLGRWTRHTALFGPPPSSPECRAPKHLLTKHGIPTGEAA